jgi:nucleotide-binding universal stress UspA family protein
MRESAAFQVLAADNATRAARALLAGAGIDFESHLRVGGAAEAIARFAREKRCHKIVMGTRRLGTLAGIVGGSVAKQVLRLTAVPVTLVREA